MEIKPLETSKINVSEIIKRIRELSDLELRNKKKAPLFPYIENFNSSTPDEKMLLNKSLLYRENFIHNQTLKHTEAFFSCKKIFSRMKKKIPLFHIAKEIPKKSEINIKKLSFRDLKEKSIDILSHNHSYHEKVIGSRLKIKHQQKKLSKSIRLIRKITPNEIQSMTPNVLKISKNSEKKFQSITLKDLPNRSKNFSRLKSDLKKFKIPNNIEIDFNNSIYINTDDNKQVNFSFKFRDATVNTEENDESQY